MKFYTNPKHLDKPTEKVSKSEIIIDSSKGICYHCSEPKDDINYSYCCTGCEDAQIKFDELDNN